ncbi:MAG: MazG-like family protein [Gammaproteobacteria bacterium]|jgi:NTP pyrophosphatase (non-canonical NTP hydrolase)
MSWNLLNQQVIHWAEERCIFANSDPKTQCLKCVSEVGELADNVAKGRNPVDDIGDTLVTLIILAKMHDLTVEECLEHAYGVISTRTGQMVNGVFEKDEPATTQEAV